MFFKAKTEFIDLSRKPHLVKCIIRLIKEGTFCSLPDSSFYLSNDHIQHESDLFLILVNDIRYYIFLVENINFPLEFLLGID